MKRFNNILLVAKALKEQPLALDAALMLAEQSTANITVLLVLPPLNAFHLIKKDRSQQDIEQAYIQHHLNQLLAWVGRQQYNAEIRCKVVIGTEFIEIIRSVLRNQHDLVIKTAEPVSWIKRLFGSTDMHLLRKCPCPLWLLKPDIAPHYNKVVANVDIQQSDSVAEPSLNQQIIEMASAFAIHNNAEFYILNAWQPEPAGMVLMWCDNPEQAEAEFNQSVYQSQQTAMTKFKNQTIAWLGQQAFDFTKPQFELLRGEPTKILTERISKIAPGLVIMGTVARTGIAGLLIGNTAEAMLEQLDCSVLAIKPRGFITPVTLDE